MGIASKAIILVEQHHTNTKIWTLQTPVRETGNLHLYEKLGYVKKGLKITFSNSQLSNILKL